MPPAPHAALLLLMLPLGAWVCGRAARGESCADPSWIVFDEMVGYWFAVAFVPLGWSTWGAGFFLFRVFDILKPQPAAWIDRNVRSGWGILLDDVFAAIYTRVALEVLMRLGVL
jgi:phosphatidylglycerophosphatase A